MASLANFYDRDYLGGGAASLFRSEMNILIYYELIRRWLVNEE